MKNRIYSQEHYDFIKKNYKYMNNTQLGNHLDVSRDVIRKQKIKLGLVGTRKVMKTQIFPDLNKYLQKKKKDFNALSLDATMRIIIKEWVALKNEKIKRERKSTIDNNINTRAQE